VARQRRRRIGRGRLILPLHPLTPSSSPYSTPTWTDPCWTWPASARRCVAPGLGARRRWVSGRRARAGCLCWTWRRPRPTGPRTCTRSAPTSPACCPTSCSASRPGWARWSARAGRWGTCWPSGGARCGRSTSRRRRQRRRARGAGFFCGGSVDTWLPSRGFNPGARGLAPRARRTSAARPWCARVPRSSPALPRRRRRGGAALRSARVRGGAPAARAAPRQRRAPRRAVHLARGLRGAYVQRGTRRRPRRALRRGCQARGTAPARAAAAHGLLLQRRRLPGRARALERRRARQRGGGPPLRR
jgi:hypothetical protein